MSHSSLYQTQHPLGRFLDVVLALAGLVVLSPLLIVVVVALVIESGFPIFFVQERIGRGGRVFRMYKFRKFHARCGIGCPLTMKNDDRMTRVGRILEATKFDEMPQLFNILRGDMAIVGPRPESTTFAECFTDSFQPLLNERPGIFGPSQVAFRNESDLYPAGKDPVVFYCETLFPSKAALDLAYYSHRSVRSDLFWIVRGVLAVIGMTPPSEFFRSATLGDVQPATTK